MSLNGLVAPTTSHLTTFQPKLASRFTTKNSWEDSTTTLRRTSTYSSSMPTSRIGTLPPSCKTRTSLSPTSTTHRITPAAWTSRRAPLLTAFELGISSFVTGWPLRSLPAGPLDPAPDISLAIGNVSTSCTSSGDVWCSGLNILAPQGTFQTDKQFKYDGTKVIGTHTLRYGVGVNRILGGGFASFWTRPGCPRAL